MLELIRERRLKVVADYEAVVLRKQATRIETLRKALEKHEGLYKKDLAVAEKAFEKLEKRVLKMRAAILEMEDM